MISAEQTHISLPAEPAKTSPGSYGFGVTAKLAALTGILLAVPALINAGYDIYAALLKLPRTDVEKINAEMFQKYFNKQPVVALPVPVKHSLGTVEVRFAIYEEGDVYVEYGKQTQWFSFPKPEGATKLARFSLVTLAHAEEPPEDKDIDLQSPWNNGKIMSQTGSLSNSNFIRNRTFENGVTEKATIDIRTGKILEIGRVKTGKGASLTPLSPPSNAPTVIRFEPIDIERIKNAR